MTGQNRNTCRWLCAGRRHTADCDCVTIFGLSEVRATSGANLGSPLLLVIGPSGVRALPLAAGINEGGHYFRYFGPSGVHALP